MNNFQFSIFNYSLQKIIVVFLAFVFVIAQDESGSIGDKQYRKIGVHSGNKVRTIYYNYGCIGGDVTGGQPEGEWPIGSGNSYVGDVSPLIGIERHREWQKEVSIVNDSIFVETDGDTISLSDFRWSQLNIHVDDTTMGTLVLRDTVYSVTTSDGPRGNTDGPSGSGEMWTFEPLPNYANPVQDYLAMSTDLDNDGVDGLPSSGDDDGIPDTWPSEWPDRPTDWAGYWNGYFGKGVKNADQESLFYMDDAADKEFNFEHQGSGDLVYQPNSFEPNRYGQGLQMKVRGLQWAHFLAEDAIFWLYEVFNIGEIDHDKVGFGMLVGTLNGGRCQNHVDSQDDLAYFDNENDITYSWDAPPGYSPCFDGPVGYVGYAFLESPGNPYNGIDDDGDSQASVSPIFSENDFMPVIYETGDAIVVIDKTDYSRTIVYVGVLPDTIETMGVKIILDGTPIEEIVGNLIDDDLDGLIDEDVDTHYLNRIEHDPPQDALRFVDYRTGAGLDDALIDEQRNDGIDNDGDWDAVTDDVGADGVAGTNDDGEGNGIPDSGEPNFDQLDIDESDQIGLTSFNYFSPPGKVRMNDDFKWAESEWGPGELWKRIIPGNYDEIVLEPADGDFMYGSGYFPLLAGDTERYSMALLYGEDFEDILRNKQIIQQIYDSNYNFTKPPEKPTVRAMAENGKITLFWDDEAEFSIDPIAGRDFEGYKIYRATDFGFNEVNTISDGLGIAAFYEPIAQFDLINDVKGFYKGSTEYTEGVSFYLGDDTGLQHSWTDTDVVNGKTYFYAVVSYDHGDDAAGISPAECTKTIQELNEQMFFDINTVSATPGSPVLGYQSPEVTTPVQISGEGVGTIAIEIIDPTALLEGEMDYEIEFISSANDGYDNNTNGEIEEIDEKLAQFTSGVSVIQLINGSADTLLFESENLNLTKPENMPATLQSFFTDESQKMPLDLGGFRLHLDIHSFATIESALYSNADSEPAVEISVAENGYPLAQNVYLDFSTPQESIEIEGYDTENIAFSLSEDSLKIARLDENQFIILRPLLEYWYPTWQVDFELLRDELPTQGKLYLNVILPITNDVFEFTIKNSGVDENEIDLSQIKVVPNPYLGASEFEAKSPYNVGRGERRIDFVNLPENATIRIFNVKGELIQTLQHDGSLIDAKVSWNLRSRDGLDIAFGVYIYHVSADNLEHIGKFAVVK